MQHATIATEYIPYTLTLSPLTGSGSGKATPITLNISGTITNANYINAAAGNFADTVVITITP
jgi:spore coat protein U-like protein